MKVPTYNVKCYECSEKHAIDLPYVGLDQEQLAHIDEGDEFQVYEHNLPLGVKPDPEQAKEIEEEGSFTDEEDYRQVCGSCGSDYSYDGDGNRIDD